MEIMREYVNALKSGSGYTFIGSGKGHEMTKAELIQIIQEFDYIMGCLSRQNVGTNAYLEYVAESIEENCIYE